MYWDLLEYNNYWDPLIRIWIQSFIWTFLIKNEEDWTKIFNER